MHEIKMLIDPRYRRRVQASGRANGWEHPAGALALDDAALDSVLGASTEQVGTAGCCAGTSSNTNCAGHDGCCKMTDACYTCSGATCH